MRPLNDPAQYDDLADLWWQPRGRFAMLHWIAAARARLVPVPARDGALLLDLACGGGLLAPHVTGYRHVGLDLSATALPQARAHGVVPVRGDVLHLPFADEVADVVVVWARDVEDKQVKGFLVEKGVEGYQAERMLGKASLRAVWQARITLTDVRVAEAMRLPGGNSFRDTGRVLAGTRYAVAWGALGHATAAYDIAMAYCMERQQFGKPLVSFQLVQDKLVKMLAEICSMQLYCLRLARLQEEGTITDTIAALAKMNNTRKARQVILEARDLLGAEAVERAVERFGCDQGSM